MRYVINHDLHIHSQLSECSSHPEQTTRKILSYAEENGYTDICLTDHFWDSTVEGASRWYAPQNYDNICKALPLPESDKVNFYFGCETEMNKFGTVGISDKILDKLDFIIVPVSHFHMLGYTLDEKDDAVERRAEKLIERTRHLLDMDLPFHKMGLAHFTACLARPTEGHPKRYLEVLRCIENDTYRETFEYAAKRGIGIEINIGSDNYTEEDWKEVERPYLIAKKCGCKFYLGGDAHTPEELAKTRARFERNVDRLGLEESDKFNFGTIRTC